MLIQEPVQIRRVGSDRRVSDIIGDRVIDWTKRIRGRGWFSNDDTALLAIVVRPIAPNCIVTHAVAVNLRGLQVNCSRGGSTKVEIPKVESDAFSNTDENIVAHQI